MSNSLQDIQQNHLVQNIEVNLCVTLIHYPKYDIHPSNILEDIKQNQWTVKYG